MNAMERGKALDAIYAAGHYLYSTDNIRDALDIFRTMLLAAPTDERPWLGLAACHEALGEEQKALRLYELGAAASSSLARIHLGRARALKSAGEVAAMHEAYAAAEEAAVGEIEVEVLAAIRAERNIK